MRVLLLNTPQSVEVSSSSRRYASAGYPPLGLAALGAYLIEVGHEVEILDLPREHNIEYAVDRSIARFDPQVVGITAMSSHFGAAAALARQVKSLSDAYVIIGGAHPTIYPEPTLRVKEIDFVCIGEGEITLTELLSSMEFNAPEISEIDGIAYRREGQIVINSPRKPIMNIDELPFPAYELIDMHYYLEAARHIEGASFAPLLVSRGCPYKCRFCAAERVLGKHVRRLSPEITVSYMQRIAHEYQPDGIWLKDSTFTTSKKWVKKFCEELKRSGFSLPWKCNTRVDAVNGEMLREMKEAGLEEVWFGIESGNNETLAWLGKQTTTEMIEDVVQQCRKLGLSSCGWMMLGIPSENENDLFQSIDFARSLGLSRIHWNIFTPLPGTALWDELMPSVIDWESFSLSYTRAMLPTINMDEDQVEAAYQLAVSGKPTPSSKDR